MKVSARCLPGFWVGEEIMREHAKEIAGKNGPDIRLVSRRVERRRFRREEDQLDDGADGEKNDRTAIAE